MSVKGGIRVTHIGTTGAGGPGFAGRNAVVGVRVSLVNPDLEDEVIASEFSGLDGAKRNGVDGTGVISARSKHAWREGRRVEAVQHAATTTTVTVP